MASLDDDRELLEQQVSFFLKECPSLLNDLRRHLDDTPNLQAGQFAAHRLKGLVARYGIAPITQLAQNLENACRDGNEEEAKGLFQQLEPLVLNLHRALHTAAQEHRE
ncbi:MAG: hypothetical protein KatS3mg111_0200 [Pirellulaceae bacterium]|nr:MAG: hypothetical protein KatS3mg111_0200 [Pirellulaceae bacterium]